PNEFGISRFRKFRSEPEINEPGGFRGLPIAQSWTPVGSSSARTPQVRPESDRPSPVKLARTAIVQFAALRRGSAFRVTTSLQHRYRTPCADIGRKQCKKKY